MKRKKTPWPDGSRQEALKIKRLIEAGERDFALGRTLTHAQVGKMLERMEKKERTKSCA